MNILNCLGKCKLWLFLIVSTMMFVTETNCFPLSTIPIEALEEDAIDTSETITPDRPHLLREETDIGWDSPLTHDMVGYSSNSHKQPLPVTQPVPKVTCDVSQYTKQCYAGTHDLGRLLNSIKTLRDRVEEVQAHEVYDGHKHLDIEIYDRLSSDQANDRAYHPSEMLMTANKKLIETACFLNKVKDNASNYGYVDYKLDNLLDNYYNMLCELHGWMNQDKVSISHVVQIEDHEFLNNDYLQDHIRKIYEYNIFNGLGVYLDRLKPNLELKLKLKQR